MNNESSSSDLLRNPPSGRQAAAESPDATNPQQGLDPQRPFSNWQAIWLRSTCRNASPASDDRSFRKDVIWASFACFVAMGECIRPEGDGNLLTDEFDKFARETLEDWKVPGISIAVIDGEDVFAKVRPPLAPQMTARTSPSRMSSTLADHGQQSYGIATFPDTRATPDTLWYGASTTKAFVDAALAHLIDTKAYPALAKGWATPIASIIRDDFVLGDAWATEHLTLEDAACHRTGFPRHDASLVRFVDDDDAGHGVGGDGRKKRYTTVKDVVRNLRNLPMTGEEPRVKFQYCNLMYIVLSHVIETLTGKWLGDVLRELIWEPLGMSSTYFSLDAARAAPEHLATGYYWDETEEKHAEAPFMSVVEISGAGAIISTAVDYAKWVRCLLHEAAPFSAAVHREIRTPRIVAGMPELGKDVTMYGLGWQRALYRGHVMYSHSGGLDCFGTQVYWFPDAKFGVVAFANTSATSNAAEDVLVYKLVHERLEIAPELQVDMGAKWHEIVDKLTKDYNKGLENIYPDRRDPPLPSPLSAKDLAGTYYDPGYKGLTLRVEAKPEKLDEETLVCDRPDGTWKFSMRFHHVTGNWWLLVMEQGVKNPPKYMQQWERVEFKIGPDGKPTALAIGWYDRIANKYESTIEFKRVDS
ncbi:hypothetical protein AK830_g3696 [Neonectria ditissima]|uniref:Beta-lactamase-related domain-containing protein n=1 Tax=Neonectria ditissima TaxID=78410 RepID=A0A0P7BN90_9HYPO|nr:hypothetical protein AK830_g3696 [Neonectria ditissima]